MTVTAVEDLPGGEGTDEQRAQGQRHLIGLAADFDVGALRRLGRQLFDVLAPAEAERREAEKLAEQERRARERARFSLRDTLETLRTGLGTVTLDTGEEISAAAERRMACTAGLIRMVRGGDSVPLDLGRKARPASTGQRVVLAARDGGCPAEDCDRPPGWTATTRRSRQTTRSASTDERGRTGVTGVMVWGGMLRSVRALCLETADKLGGAGSVTTGRRPPPSRPSNRR